MHAPPTETLSVKDLLTQYEQGLYVTFPTQPQAAYERRLIFDHLVEPQASTLRQRFEAIAGALRDLLAQRWLLTSRTYDREKPKQVYYLSMEFLLGRSLTNNLTNLLVEPIVHDIIQREGLDLLQLAQEEPDAGLGNGGLGRLAACFVDSLATMQIPAVGYGLRYHYGIFRQQIQNGHQIEHPDPWLGHPDPWEVARSEEIVPVKFTASIRLENGVERVFDNQPAILLGTPYDRPVIGYGGKTISTLRLWEASAPEAFDFDEFSRGDFVGAVHQKIIAESLTRVLYPDDSTERGRSLRFAQEYFLVACSLADIMARFRRRGNEWQALPEKVPIQLNDTHPAIAVAELMRILLDQAGRPWEEAWDLTTRTLAYTNHTLLPEALEKWPVQLFELLVPRHLQIIYEINRRFLFGLTAEEVLASRGWYNPHWHYEHEPNLRYALDMIRDNAFSHAEHGVFAPIWDVLITYGDHYMHLADLSSYARTQEKVGEMYVRPEAWGRKAILNVGHSGKFSSDRTIAEYAAKIWRVKPCPVR
jgi:starch phosphorylase